MEISLCMQATCTNTTNPLYVRLELNFLFPSLIYNNVDHNLFGFTVLNKCDLLQAKLQRGVRIRDSVPSFGDRKNDLHTATRCTFLLLFVSPNIVQNKHLTLFFYLSYLILTLDQIFNNTLERSQRIIRLLYDLFMSI